MIYKRCTKCQKEKSLNEFYKGKNNAWCISCYRESNLQNFRNKKSEFKVRLKNWRSNNREHMNETQRKYRESHPEIMREWKDKYPEKYHAHVVLSNAVRDGKIIKPKTCQNCGSTGKIQGHHWHGYDENHILDVQWLCQPCHEKVDHHL